MANKRTVHFPDSISCGYRYRIYPTKEQIALFNQQFGGMRFIYNYILGNAIAQYENEKKNNLPHTPYRFSFSKFKKDNPQIDWLKKLIASSATYEYQNYQTAMNNFFRRVKENKEKGLKQKVGFPKFKCRRKDKDSFKFQTQDCTHKSKMFDWEHKQIYIPKIGMVKAIFHRKFEGYCSSVTVTRDNNEYYVSLTLELRKPKELPATHKNVGIDMGKRDNLMITSDGEKIPNQKYLNKYLKKLARLQRKFSRQQDNVEVINGKNVIVYSKNKQKTQRKIRKLHSHIKNARTDYIHKHTIDLIRRYDFIGLENLNIRGMLKNPPKNSNTTDNNTTNSNTTKSNTTKSKRPCRSQRKGNHRTTADASWYKIRHQFEYKADWYGKKVEVIKDKMFPSSQLCHCCGSQNPEVKDLNKYKGDYTCPKCGALLNRDVNAAINIRERALNPKYREKEIRAFKKYINNVRASKKAGISNTTAPVVVKKTYKKRRNNNVNVVVKTVSVRKIKKLRNSNTTI